jgi:nitroreductase
VADLAEEKAYVAKGFDPWLSSAPALVVVAFSEGDYRERYAARDKGGLAPEDWPVSYPLIDCGASLMLLLLAAVDRGLAAGFIGAHRLAGIEELLGIPQDITAVGVVTLGYPAPDRRSSSLAAGWRPLHDVVHWDRWGSPGPGISGTSPPPGA